MGAPSLYWFNCVCASVYVYVCVCISARTREVIIDHVDDVRVNDSNATNEVAAQYKGRTIAATKQTTKTALTLFVRR